MSISNESIKAVATATPSTQSSYTSKISQRLVHPSFFSLKPSTSGFINSTNEKLSTRISQMIFRQRISSETTINKEETRAFSSQSLDLNTSDRLDIDFSSNSNKEKMMNDLSIASRFSTDKNNNQNSNTLYSPYSISSPEGTTDYSFISQDEYNNLNPLFSPLSLTNSSTSSFTDSILSHHITQMSSPFIPFLSTEPNTNISTVKSTVEEFANIVSERCSLLLDLLLSNDDITFSHVRELESIINQAQILLTACSDTDCTDTIYELQQQLTSSEDFIQNEIFHSSLTNLKGHVSMLISITTQIKTFCKVCLVLVSKSPSLSMNCLDEFVKESPKVETKKMTAKDYCELKSDQIDENATWFRCYFVGKPYRTFIGYSDQDTTHSSLLVETAYQSSSSSSSSSDITHQKKKKSSSSKRRNSKLLINAFLNGYNSSTDTINGSDHRNSIGFIISIIQERAKDFSGPGNVAASILGSQFRIIVRSKEPEQSRHIIHEWMARDTQSRLESKNEGYKLDKSLPHDRRFLRPFSSKNGYPAISITSQNETHSDLSLSRMLRAAILTACPTIDLRSFKELSAESTIMAGLEKDILKYDEIQIPKHYKFGLLSIKDNQMTEEAWFSNTDLSSDLQDFLNVMGKKIELKEYKGYAAGLDTKTGESGKYAYVSKWNDFDILFHVAPLMPSHNNDKQQVLRKKHIGNDIVCIIFLEGNQKFNPNAIRSQFLHVYIIIKPESIKGKRHWRVEILRKKNIIEFGPALPSPPLFDNDETLKEFLILKLINAENAALKSDKFYIPNNKARVSLLSSYIQTGLSFHRPQVVRSVSTNRLTTSYKSSLSVKQTEQPLRPKSVNTDNNKLVDHQINNAPSSRLLREAMLDEEKRRRSTISNIDIPSSLSRTTLLQDFKRGLVSHSKKEEVINHRKASCLIKTSSHKFTHEALESVEERNQNQQEKVDMNTTSSPANPVSSTNKPGSIDFVE